MGTKKSILLLSTPDRIKRGCISKFREVFVIMWPWQTPPIVGMQIFEHLGGHDGPRGSDRSKMRVLLVMRHGYPALVHASGEMRFASLIRRQPLDQRFFSALDSGPFGDDHCT